MRCVSVVIADRHPVVLQGLASVLTAESGFRVVACCSDGRSCMEAIRTLVPEIAILDVSLPGLTGLEVLTIANSEGLSTRLVFFVASVVDRELIVSAAVGPYGVVFKDADLETAGAVLASGRGRPEVIAAARLGPDRIAGASEHRENGECVGRSDGSRARDHASGVRRVVEQGNRAPA